MRRTSELKKRCTAVALCLGLLAGCGPRPPAAQPASGEVLVGGQPAAGAELVFYPVEPPAPELLVPIPRAFADADGRFKVTTYKGEDGAPAGEYKLSITWMTERPDDVDPESFQRIDRLGGRYADPEDSGIQVTIESGENSLAPFDLSI